MNVLKTEDINRICDIDKKEQVFEILKKRSEWDAIDILKNNEIPPSQRLDIVLREEFINQKLLHIFACKCSERALKKSNVKNETCWKAVRAKMFWLAGTITDKELYLADHLMTSDTAYFAFLSSRFAAHPSARTSALTASSCAVTSAIFDYDRKHERNLVGSLLKDDVPVSDEKIDDYIRRREMMWQIRKLIQIILRDEDLWMSSI